MTTMSCNLGVMYIEHGTPTRITLQKEVTIDAESNTKREEFFAREK